MKKILFIMLSSFLAGALIALGATSYLVLSSNCNLGYKIFGSFLFGIGLFTIITYNLWLFTGKVGYALDNKKIYIIKLVLCLIFNLMGSLIMTLILKVTPIGDNVKEYSKTLVSNKYNEKWYELLILSCMCGIMIFLSVDGYKKCENIIGKILFVFLPIMLFILCGFEHVVANITYFTYSGIIRVKIIPWFIIMALGNAIGSLTFYGLYKLIIYLQKDKEI